MGENTNIVISKEKHKTSKNVRRYTFLLLTLLIVAGVIVLAVTIKQNINKKNSAFVINGVAYSKSTVKSIIAFPEKGNEQKAGTLSLQVYNYLKREQAAKNLGIQPSSQAIAIQARDNFGSYNNYQSQLNKLSWIKLVSYDEALQQNLYTLYNGQYSGYLFIFWAGQHLEKGPIYTSPNYNNLALVDSDQKYAHQQAEYYYSQLKNHTINDQNALSSINANSKLNEVGYVGYVSLSTSFNVNNWRNKLYYPDIINYVSSQKNSGLSNVRASYIQVSQTETQPYFYYIVDLKTAHYEPVITQYQFNSAVNKVNSVYNGI